MNKNGRVLGIFYELLETQEWFRRPKGGPMQQNNLFPLSIETEKGL